MFMVDAETAAAIQRAYETEGELSAVIELRRHFPGITDNEAARRCVRQIAGWQTPVTPPSDEPAKTSPDRRAPKKRSNKTK